MILNPSKNYPEILHKCTSKKCFYFSCVEIDWQFGLHTENNKCSFRSSYIALANVRTSKRVFIIFSVYFELPFDFTQEKIKALFRSTFLCNFSKGWKSLMVFTHVYTHFACSYSNISKHLWWKFRSIKVKHNGYKSLIEVLFSKSYAISHDRTSVIFVLYIQTLLKSTYSYK